VAAGGIGVKYRNAISLARTAPVTAGDGTTIVVDGFSCRRQAQHGTRRRPQHLAAVLASALP